MGQFLKALGSPLNVKLDEIIQADRAFFARQGWILLVQGVLSLILMFVRLPPSAPTGKFRALAICGPSTDCHWALRQPVIAGYPFYTGPPVSFMFALTIVAGLAFARLLSSLLATGWRTQLVYWLITLMHPDTAVLYAGSGHASVSVAFFS